LLTHFVTGNAEVDGATFRGWIVGHFIPEALGPRSSQAVEIKWGVHRRDETRQAWAATTHATTLSMLIRGSIRLFFRPTGETLLCQPGDYAVWGPGVAHRWRIEDDDTVVLTVRWPSRPGDAADLAEP
jgi:hypothetical protein